MKVTVAETAGFCFGVTRAVDMCRQVLEKYGACRTLGPIIHNSHVVAALEEEGAAPAGGIDEIRPGDVVLIRSHGVTEQELRELAGIMQEQDCSSILQFSIWRSQFQFFDKSFRRFHQ